MIRIVLYLVGFVVLIIILVFGYVAYLTEKSRVKADPEETNYDETGPVVNGFAIVVKKYPRDLWGNGQNRYGFVDARGKRITFVKYLSATNFSEERAVVMGGDMFSPRFGFIDPTGRELIPLIYSNANSFINGLSLVQKDEVSGYAVGFIDRQGREVGPFKYTKYAALNEGYYPVGVGKMNEEKWGYVDTAGREIVAPQYDEASPFFNGYAVVGKRDEQRYLMQYGLIDTTGRVVIPISYSSVEFRPATGLVDVTTTYESAPERWHTRKGKVNLRNEVVEPLTDVPD